MHEIRLPARIEHLQEFTGFVTSFAERHGFLEEQIQRIELSLEEALVNICNYAYPDLPDGEIEVSCSLAGEDRLVIEIRDQGIPFDVEAQSDPELSADLSERRIGGLGIFLIKKMMDVVKYRRKDGRNILTLTLKKRATT